MSDYHEPRESLSEGTRNVTRALRSLKEEVEAIDWYNQRVDACGERHLFTAGDIATLEEESEGAGGEHSPSRPAAGNSVSRRGGTWSTQASKRGPST